MQDYLTSVRTPVYKTSGVGVGGSYSIGDPSRPRRPSGGPETLTLTMMLIISIHMLTMITFTITTTIVIMMIVLMMLIMTTDTFVLHCY